MIDLLEPAFALLNVPEPVKVRVSSPTVPVIVDKSDEEAVVVASLRYMQIPLAALVAYLALGETVTLSEVAGGIVVIGSCLFIVWREMKKSRSANSAPAPADPVT